MRTATSRPAATGPGAPGLRGRCAAQGRELPFPSAHRGRSMGSQARCCRLCRAHRGDWGPRLNAHMARRARPALQVRPGRSPSSSVRTASEWRADAEQTTGDRARAPFKSGHKGQAPTSSIPTAISSCGHQLCGRDRYQPTGRNLHGRRQQCVWRISCRPVQTDKGGAASWTPRWVEQPETAAALPERPAHRPLRAPRLAPRGRPEARRCPVRRPARLRSVADGSRGTAVYAQAWFRSSGGTLVVIVSARRVVLLGGGFSTDEDGLLDDWLLDHARSPRPKVCFVPTASGDAPVTQL